MSDSKPRVRRSRVRNLDTGNKAAARPETPDAIKELALTVFSENKAMNAAKGKHDKARKSLTGSLNDLKVDKKSTDFNFGSIVDAKRVELEISLVEGQATVIDMKKLKSLVDAKTFESIITTTKSAIKAACGDTITDQCVTSKGNGKFTASVKAAS